MVIVESPSSSETTFLIFSSSLYFLLFFRDPSVFLCSLQLKQGSCSRDPVMSYFRKTRASWCAIQYCDNVYFIPRWTNTIKGWLLIVLTPFEIVSEYIVCAKLAVCA